jgi:hypothetical protein
MANSGYVEATLGGLEDDVKQPVMAAFDYVLDNWTIGPLEHGERATNLSAVWLTGTTSSVANQEFTIAHGLERTPTYVLPVAALGEVGSQVVPLTVSRAADGVRIYLASSSTSAPIALLVG